MPRSAKPLGKSVKKAAVSKPAQRSPTKKASSKVAASKKAPHAKVGSSPLDLSALPPESVTQMERSICLACVLDVFTRHMGLAPKTAHLEIKRYTPPVAELYASPLTRPYFDRQSPKDPCPYCGSA